jgi:predicted metalloprotease with PDZ domain
MYRVGSLVLLLAALPAAAQPTRPIEVSLDATEAPRKILRSRLVIPVEPGPLTLHYPKWIPGEHSPSGPINDLTGLKLKAGGKSLAWRRDDVDLYSFHCEVPAGVDSIEASLEYLAPQVREAEGFSSGTTLTSKLAILNWNLVTLYPKGRHPRDIHYRATVTLPTGWKFGTSLPVAWTKGDQTQFEPVSLETLIDSTVLAGAYFREIPIGLETGPRHFLVLACDSPSGLKVSDAVKTQYDRLVAEAGKLFGVRHYRSYRFLVALSDQIRSDAIEHHESSDNRMPERFFVDDDLRKSTGVWVLPHEYVHSWNGKYRRPAGLTTLDFQQPMKTRELWVYEGLTQYLGFVLTARSTLYSPELSRENYALIADWAKLQSGRTWRPLEDTTVAAPTLYYARADLASRRRGVDFYDEGALLWLDVDTLIREKSGGKKTFDDFCRLFFGGKEGSVEVRPYTFDELVATLNQVMAHDWKGFLMERLTSTSAEPPVGGIARAGWKLGYKTTAGSLFKARETENKSITLMSSIGLRLRDDGTVTDVAAGSLADKAGIGPSMKLIAVNDRRWNSERLLETVGATADKKGKLKLLMENQEYFRTFALDYSGGHRYPHLERDSSRPDLLTAIFDPAVGP